MKLVLLIVSFACLLIACKSEGPDDQKSSGPTVVDLQRVFGIGRIEPENEIIQISAEVGGIVQKVYKKENEAVQAGEIIVELKHTIEDANINQLNLAIAVQEAQIKVDESAIKEFKIRLNNASIELERLKSLLAKGAETQQIVDNATAEMQSFQANIQKLQATVEVSRMKWKESKAQIGVAEAQLKQKFIRAPAKGIVLELNVQVGNYIDSKEVFVQINPEGKTIAVCEIDELFAQKIEVGQDAIIRNFGALDTLSTGKVYFAASFLKKKSLFTDQPGEKEDRRVREIKLLLDDPAGILLNSRIECVVSISKKTK